MKKSRYTEEQIVRILREVGFALNQAFIAFSLVRLGAIAGLIPPRSLLGQTPDRIFTDLGGLIPGLNKISGFINYDFQKFQLIHFGG